LWENWSKRLGGETLGGGTFPFSKKEKFLPQPPLQKENHSSPAHAPGLVLFMELEALIFRDFPVVGKSQIEGAFEIACLLQFKENTVIFAMFCVILAIVFFFRYRYNNNNIVRTILTLSYGRGSISAR